MSPFLDNIRNAGFTGLNRAFGKGKHSPKSPHSDSPYHDRGISGGPISSQDSRNKSGFAKIGHPHPNSGSLLDDGDTGPAQVAIRAATVFFIMINIFIYIAIAVFQKKWKVGPSGLTGLAIFVLIQAFLNALILLLVPQIYKRTDVLRGFARTIRLTRIRFIIYGTQASLAFILSLVTTISAYTGGCKNHSADPNAANKAYVAHLGGFCRNKRAAAAFWWFSFLCFGLSLGIVFKSWYSTRKFGPTHPSFEPPQGVGPRGGDEEEDEFEPEEPYQSGGAARPQEMSAVRPSNVGGYYGERPVFEADRVPPGYGPPAMTEVVYNRPAPAQMTAYKDPFDEIRAQIYQTGR